MKRSATRRIFRDPYFVGIFFYIFWGLFGVTNGRTVGPRYTAPKLSAISYLFGTFSLLIMGDTERPRYSGFRGLSVHGITALQCISKYYQNHPSTCMFKFIQLCRSTGKKLKNLAIFLNKAFKLRNSTLNHILR